MANKKNKWQVSEIKIPIKRSGRKFPGAPDRFRYGIVRTDGNTVQIRVSVNLPAPCGTIEDFNEDYAEATHGLVDVVLQMETNHVILAEDESYVEGYIKAIGWREELTIEEESAITNTTFTKEES